MQEYSWWSSGSSFTSPWMIPKQPPSYPWSGDGSAHFAPNLNVLYRDPSKGPCDRPAIDQKHRQSCLSCHISCNWRYPSHAFSLPVPRRSAACRTRHWWGHFHATSGARMTDLRGLFGALATILRWRDACEPAEGAGKMLWALVAARSGIIRSPVPITSDQ